VLLSADYMTILYAKIVDIESGLMELFANVTEVCFFSRHIVYSGVCREWISCAIIEVLLLRQCRVHWCVGYIDGFRCRVRT